MPLSKKELISQAAEIGLYPSKKLGQNFLLDGNLARAIVADAAIEPDSHVCEVGPGMGALTETIIASQARHITLIERDHRLAERLQKIYAQPSHGRIELFCADAAQLDQRLLFSRGEGVTLIGNLPYKASTAIIEHWSSPFSPVKKMILMLQREVADRLLAAPGTPEYGLWTILLQLGWRAQKLRSVPPEVFWPRPQVDSTVVVLERLPSEKIPRCDHQALRNCVIIGFSSRRKQLRSLLQEKATPLLPPRSKNPFSPAAWQKVVEQLGVSVDVRAEALSMKEWVALTEYFFPLPTSDQQEYFDVVDEHDQLVNTLERSQVHAQQLRHRAIHILLKNSLGEIFLQKRSPWKEHAPNKWCSSAAGHLHSGETYLTAAHRELQEELRITCPLKQLGIIPASPLTHNEFITCFLGESEGPFHLNPEEIITGSFFSQNQIHHWLQNTTATGGGVSPVFRLIWQRWF